MQRRRTPRLVAAQNVSADEVVPGGLLVVQQQQNDVEAAQQWPRQRHVVRHRVLVLVLALEVLGVHGAEDGRPAWCRQQRL